MADHGAMDTIRVAYLSQLIASNLEHPSRLVAPLAQTPNPSPEGRRAKISGCSKLGRALAGDILQLFHYFELS